MAPASTESERPLATRLTLFCCAATAIIRAGGFARADEPLDAGGRDKARRRTVLPRPERVVSSPARAALETAAAMGFAPEREHRLADLDHAPWQGLTLAEAHARAPEQLAAWLAAPERGTPAGESLAAARRRVRPWLAGVADDGRGVLAITHAAIVRAILAEALDMPDGATMRFDIAPLATVRLSFHHVWRVQQLGAD